MLDCWSKVPWHEIFGFNWFSQNNPSELLVNQLKYFRFWFKFAERFEFKVLLCILRIQTVLYGGFSVYSMYSFIPHFSQYCMLNFILCFPQIHAAQTCSKIYAIRHILASFCMFSVFSMLTLTVAYSNTFIFLIRFEGDITGKLGV